MADDIIADECIHLMTTAFCTICKAQSKAAETRRRRTRATNHPSWDTDQTLPYPTIIASYSSTCPHCDEGIQQGTEIHNVDGFWVCHQCGIDAAIMEGAIPHA